MLVLKGFSAVPLKAKKQEKGAETPFLGLFKKVLNIIIRHRFNIHLIKCVIITIQVQSSAGYKSPGAALKLATMKRMRDAGWTTVTNLDQKKKKVTEKIFA